MMSDSNSRSQNGDNVRPESLPEFVSGTESRARSGSRSKAGSESRGKRGRGLNFLLVYLVLFGVCIAAIYAYPSLKGLLKRSYLAQSGEVELTQEVDAYIVREDTVYSSEKAGTVNRLVDAGDLVKGGSRIVEISGEGRDEMGTDIARTAESLGDDMKKAEGGISSTAGYISYTVDGAENRLNSKTIGTLTEKQFKEYTAASVRKLSDKKVAAGEPIFKTTRNGEWWIVFFAQKNDAERYSEGMRVELTIDDNSVRAYVKSISKPDEKGDVKIILKCNVYLEGYLELRHADATVTLSSATGLLISNDSIVTKNKRKGVIVINKLGEYVFKPICIKSDDGETSAVAEDYYMDEKGFFIETVKVYDEILSKPDKNDVKEAA